MQMRHRRFTLPGLVLLLAAGLFLGDVSTVAAPLTSTINIPIAGTVNGPTEAIAFSGTAKIASTFVLDLLLGEVPREIITIDLVNVSGVGVLTGTRYVATGHNTLLRPLATSDTLEMTFPFFPATPGGTSQARSLLASFSLNFNLLTGGLTGGTASFSTPTPGV